MLTMAGAGMSLAAQHSQSLEAWICHLPGLKVVMPCTPYDAKGLIISAARDDNPVIVVLNKMSLAIQGAGAGRILHQLPLGKPNIVREGGSNYTIVSLGPHDARSVRRRQRNSKEFGVDAEVHRPCVALQPFDTDAVVASVKKTHRAMIVHEAVRFGGFGGEIAAQIQELAFDYLDAPVARVGAPFSPVPFSPVLEATYVPNADRIVAEAKQQLGL